MVKVSEMFKKTSGCFYGLFVFSRLFAHTHTHAAHAAKKENERAVGKELLTVIRTTTTQFVSSEY